MIWHHCHSRVFSETTSSKKNDGRRSAVHGRPQAPLPQLLQHLFQERFGLPDAFVVGGLGRIPAHIAHQATFIFNADDTVVPAGILDDLEDFEDGCGLFSYDFEDGYGSF